MSTLHPPVARPEFARLAIVTLKHGVGDIVESDAIARSALRRVVSEDDSSWLIC